MWGNIPDWAVQAIDKILEAVRNKDRFTYEHCMRVGVFSRFLAELAGLNEYEQQIASYSGTLHDIGKILIPSSIIHKPGPLNNEEFTMMKNHPMWSASALTPYLEEDLFQKILPGVLHHHERIDGHGYPDKLTGDNIPLIARIVTLVDTMDAITQARSYRKDQSFDFVISEVKRCAGKQFDSQLSAIFLETSEVWREIILKSKGETKKPSFEKAA